MTTKNASNCNPEPTLLEQSLSAYGDDVEYHFEELFIIQIYWVRPDPALLAGAQEDGWTPEQFAAWHGNNKGFTIIKD